MKVFMGGTCNGSDWRNRIIPMLKVGFFNPVVDDWTPDCMAEELRQREECDVCLYVITPKMTGVYSVAEVIDDSNKRPARTVFVRLRDDGDEKFTDGQWKSLGAVAQMVERNGGTAFDSLESAALHINAMTPNYRITHHGNTKHHPHHLGNTDSQVASATTRAEAQDTAEAKG